MCEFTVQATSKWMRSSYTCFSVEILQRGFSALIGASTYQLKEMFIPGFGQQQALLLSLNLLNLVTEIFTDLTTQTTRSHCQKSLSHTLIFIEAAKPSVPTSSFPRALFVSFSRNHTMWWKDCGHLLKSCFCLQLAIVLASLSFLICKVNIT